MGVNLGQIAHNILGFDPTPGFNLGRGNGAPQIDASGTTNRLGQGNQVTAPAAAKNNGGSGTAAPVQPQDPAASGPVTDTSGANAGGTPQEYGLYTGQAQDALSRALQAWNATQSGVNQQYGTQFNELQGGLQNAQTQHDQGVTQSQQDRLTATNQANQQGAASYQSLLSLLGGMGAGGGSEAQYLVPQLVNQEVSQNLSGVGQTYAKNARALDTTLGNFQNEEKTAEQKLNDWKATQLANGQAGYSQTQSNLLGLLAGLNSKAAPAADLGSQVASIAGGIQNQASLNPTYNGTTPIYTPASLDSYTAGSANTAQVTPAAGGASATPYLDLLMGIQKKQQPGLV